MKIEVRDWKTNREVMLIDDLGIRASFYTQATEADILGKCAIVPPNCTQNFKLLEASLPPPVIGGHFAPLHPYWEEHGWTVSR